MAAEGARRWLEARRPPAPAELVSRLREDLEELAGSESAGSLAEVFTGAALRRLRRARKARGTRGGAFELLAADAHLTHACEAVVDADAREDGGSEPGSTVEDAFLAMIRRVAGEAG